MNNEFNINEVIDKLKSKKKVFNSEADFQLEIAMTIKKLYPSSKIVLEYCPRYNTSVYIDILVIIDSKYYYPIELKYKTKETHIVYDDIDYYLKQHSAKNINCYLCLKDIERIEKFKDNEKQFEKGYTIVLTNDLSYLDEPRANSQYTDFSIHQGAVKKGTMKWNKDSSKLKSEKYGKEIKLKGNYPLDWKLYSELDSEDGTKEKFMYLVNEIDK